MIGERDLIKAGVLRVAELMAIAAKTAPKARGVDNIAVAVVSDREELEKLASKMEELSTQYGQFLARDAENVRNSEAVVLVGAKVVDLGLKTPSGYRIDMNSYMALVNLGIAVGSAVKAASILNVDNRIMLSIGLAAKELKLIDAEYILGIPLSATAKNIYFDRKK
ncbi:MAG: ferredoxin [Desulfurococcales archaeon]|nr:ferredoxin [Desulfurococcales archaeon]